ncbi:MAG: hypothetical protein ACI97A_001898 [Planctomycetota bacterium]|jgi:hypothetical protein
MEPVSGIIFGIICAIVADSRGRSAVGWFFIGFFLPCIGLFILLVLPDLKVMERRDSELNQENRRLREQIRRDRALSDSRHSDTMRRIDTHDDLLQVDTSTPPALPTNFAYGEIGEQMQELSPESEEYVRAAWWYADPREGKQIGPVIFSTLQGLWDEDVVCGETLVWCEMFKDWDQVDDIFELRERLDA